MISAIRFWIWWVFHKAKSLFFGIVGIKKQLDMTNLTEHRGELIVDGMGEVEIFLRDMPHHVEVMFKPKHEPPTCEHGHHHHHKHEHHHSHHQHDHDHLEWEVHKRSHGHTYVLEIRWKVEDIREIIWSVSY